ncbi:MAG: hydantoinase/oxoprolinase family protein, partial [Defluviicoccus sp.]|nr:hydantoinase/oxoprolinase family protein [Defluviicoccus sp.]
NVHGGIRIGVDVGGTFTDFYVMDGGGSDRIHKVLSTPDDPTDAVMRGLAEVADREGLDISAFLAGTARIVHGTTVTTNAVLTGGMAKTGLLATAGFRDALAMRRGIREKLYDNKYAAPTPIVPRRLRLPVRERIDRAGTVRQAIVIEDVDRAADIFAREGIEAVAICLLHAYANDEHERSAADRMRECLPDVYVAASNDILPQIRYYERTSTTVLAAAVGPIFGRYVARLNDRLIESGFSGPLLIMQSNGGVAAPETAAANAATTLLSGPAAAPAASLAVTAPHREDSFIVIDMGGTSFEASLVRDERPAIANGKTVDRFAMALPAMDIKTIGAGGGSIGWIDGGGLLRMGPDSAGAAPGPACYGLGGTRPTCSDASLVLGYLSATGFAGGRMTLDVGAARDAIERDIARPLGIGTVAAAAGMYRVMTVGMASAIREISIERGLDPREFPLVCAGGAGAIHAAAIAHELGITRIMVPRVASVLCAAGMLATDLRHDFVRSLATPFDTATADVCRLESLADAMAAEARATLAAENVPEDRYRLDFALDLRYSGQYHEVEVRAPDRSTLTDIEAMTAAFHAAHDRLYGYALPDGETPVELIGVRLAAFGTTEKPAARPLSGRGEPVSKGMRNVYLPDRDAFENIETLDGATLPAGFQGNGPAIVDTPLTTAFVPAGFAIAVDDFGTLILTDRGA